MLQKMIPALALSFFLISCTSQAEMTGQNAEFQTASSSASSVTVQTPAVTERLESGGILHLGKDDAPISMLLFINHGSTYAQQFHQSLLPRLIADYVQQGTMQIGIVPLQFKKYPDSQMSAGLLLCAAAQGKGVAMNDLLFSNPDSKNLQKQMDAMGLNLAALKDCLEGDNLKRAFDSEAALAQSFHITVVPSYTINSTVYTGLPEYADLKGQIETHKR